MPSRTGSRWIVIVGTLILAGFAAIGSADEPEDESEYSSLYETGTQERVVRLDMPPGNYVCRFESWYTFPEGDYPREYFQANAWLFDEDYGHTVSFSFQRGRTQKLVSINEVPEEDADDYLDQINAWNDHASYLADQWLLLDRTPRLEVDLSRAFRKHGFRWLFACTEIRWPVSWYDGE